MTSMSRAVVIGLLAMTSQAAAHGGGLNAEGCHNDRRNGGYHCHRGGAQHAPALPLRNAPASDDRQRLERGGGGATHFANCNAARAAGAAPVRRGDPGYAGHLDRDGDGVGCE
jgi:hypothetical protein